MTSAERRGIRRDLDHLGSPEAPPEAPPEPRACSCGATISLRVLALDPTATRCSWCALKALSRDAEDGPGAHDGAIERAVKETP